MSRIDELKKQFPELNITIFDIFKLIDTSKSYKYHQLLCKILGKRFKLESQYEKDVNLDIEFNNVKDSLTNRGISTKNLTKNEVLFISQLTDFFPNDSFTTIKEFIHYMDKNLIEDKDVSSYSTIDDLRNANSLASLKEINKDLESQTIKEYEDETWVVVRPLTFQSSVKYGASTRWCTTYKHDKEYFEKYWRKGVLVYFINKKTGFKFAGYKDLSLSSLEKDKLSFWNQEDSRVDYLELDVDDYLFPIVKKIFTSKDTNKNLCSDELQEKVHSECLSPFRKMSISVPVEELVQQHETPEAGFRFISDQEYENENMGNTTISFHDNEPTQAA